MDGWCRLVYGGGPEIALGTHESSPSVLGGLAAELGDPWPVVPLSEEYRSNDKDL